MSHYDEFEEAKATQEHSVKKWKKTEACSILKIIQEIKQEMLQLKFEITLLKREIR
jgi:hypothetical protein